LQSGRLRFWQVASAVAALDGGSLDCLGTERALLCSFGNHLCRRRVLFRFARRKAALWAAICASRHPRLAFLALRPVVHKEYKNPPYWTKKTAKYESDDAIFASAPYGRTNDTANKHRQCKKWHRVRNSSRPIQPTPAAPVNVVLQLVRASGRAIIFQLFPFDSGP
jgi:hypothetical protein